MSLKGNIEFIVRGNIDGVDITPNSIPLSTLSNFTSDITDLLKSIQEEKKDEIIVSVSEGSFKINAFVAMTTISVFSTEIKILNDTNNLADIDPKRSKVIERWLSRTSKSSNIEYIISPEGNDILKINSDSKLVNTKSDLWLDGDYYLYGIITDMGGDTKPNIHFKTNTNTNLIINCSKDDIINIKDNLIYQVKGIRVKAKQNVLTAEIKDAEFISFVEYNPQFDLQSLQNTIAKGREAWSDVEDHLEWVKNLRSDDE